MLKRLSMDKKILSAFSIIFVVVVCSFFLFLYIYMSNVLVESEIKNLEPTSRKISDQIDMTYLQLNNGAAGYTSNSQNLDIISKVYTGEGDFSVLDYNILSQNLESIYSVIPELHKIIISIPEKDLFFSYVRDSNGIHTIPEKYKTEEYKDFPDYFKLQGPHLDDWSIKPEVVFSTCYKFSTPFQNVYGMIEIQMPYEIIDNICKIDGEEEKMLLIYDENGKLIYPYISQGNNNYRKSFEEFYREIKGNDSGKVNDDSNKSIYYNSYNSSYTKWTTVVAVDGVGVATKLHNYRNIIFILSLSILAICLGTYYLLIKKMLTPLKELTYKVHNTSLQELALQIDENGSNEISMLNEAFENMFSRLSESIQKEYEWRIREVESLYSSLQSQINPHFLYNTLNVIFARCEDNDSDIAAQMCVQLSEILRYNASSPGTKVTLEREIQHSIYYLELMKLHYENELTYEIDIDKELYSLNVPKFTLQPFVENCINHGFKKVLPPWSIKIEGRKNNNAWSITITDNGDGISEENLEKLREDIILYRNNFIERKLINNLNMGGLGVLNTYSRLLIYFGQKFDFSVDRNEGAGISIRFGGTLDD